MVIVGPSPGLLVVAGTSSTIESRFMSLLSNGMNSSFSVLALTARSSDAGVTLGDDGDVRGVVDTDARAVVVFFVVVVVVVGVVVVVVLAVVVLAVVVVLVVDVVVVVDFRTVVGAAVVVVVVVVVVSAASTGSVGADASSALCTAAGRASASPAAASGCVARGAGFSVSTRTGVMVVRVTWAAVAACGGLRCRIGPSRVRFTTSSCSRLEASWLASISGDSVGLTSARSVISSRLASVDARTRSLGDTGSGRRNRVLVLVRLRNPSGRNRRRSGRPLGPVGRADARAGASVAAVSAVACFTDSSATTCFTDSSGALTSSAFFAMMLSSATGFTVVLIRMRLCVSLRLPPRRRVRGLGLRDPANPWGASVVTDTVEAVSAATVVASASAMV